MRVPRSNKGMQPTANELEFYPEYLAVAVESARRLIPGVRYRVNSQAVFTIDGSKGFPLFKTP